MNQPAFEKDNEMTRLSREVAEVNASRGKPAGRSAYGRSAPLVQSGAMVQPIQREVPLTPEQMEYFDNKARELGILPPKPDVADVIMDPIMHPVPANLEGVPLRPGRIIGVNGPATIPNFANIQSIDLIKGVVIVDSAAFPLPEQDIKSIKAYVLEVVQNEIQQRLFDAMYSVRGPVTEAPLEDMPDSPAKPTRQVRKVRAVRERKKEAVASRKPRAGKRASSKREPETVGNQSETT